LQKGQEMLQLLAKRLSPRIDLPLAAAVRKVLQTFRFETGLDGLVDGFGFGFCFGLGLWLFFALCFAPKKWVNKKFKCYKNEKRTASEKLVEFLRLSEEGG